MPVSGGSMFETMVKTKLKNHFSFYQRSICVLFAFIFAILNGSLLFRHINAMY